MRITHTQVNNSCKKALYIYFTIGETGKVDQNQEWSPNIVVVYCYATYSLWSALLELIASQMLWIGYTQKYSLATDSR